MPLYDRTIGRCLMTLNTVWFVYYVVWIGVTPFVDPGHFTHLLFPPREYGIAISALILSTLIVVALTVGSLHILVAAAQGVSTTTGTLPSHD